MAEECTTFKLLITMKYFLHFPVFSTIIKIQDVDTKNTNDTKYRRGRIRRQLAVWPLFRLVGIASRYGRRVVFHMLVIERGEVG